jgi:hypothetical protein
MLWSKQRSTAIDDPRVAVLDPPTSARCNGPSDPGGGPRGFALANKGHDTRARQAYLGHRNSSTRCAIPSWRRIGSRTFGESEADLVHLGFFPNHTGAISRAKMAAPIRADIRMSRLETPKT